MLKCLDNIIGDAPNLVANRSMENNFLVNKKLSEPQLQALKKIESDSEPFLFAIVGDISADAKYSTTVLLVTEKSLFTYDFNSEEQSEHYYFSDIEKVYSKRMYSNGMMRVKLHSGETHDLFRFTFSVTALCDAVASFVSEVNKGETLDSAMETMQGVYEKLLSVCPKCGRTLSAPGAPCVNCMGKSKVLKTFGAYLKPELTPLIVSLFLSIIATAMSLVPPLLTRTLVDDVLPNNNIEALKLVVFFIIATDIVYFGISGIRGYMLRVSGNKIIARLRCDVYEKAQYLPMRFYDKTSTGAVINRISGDTATIQSFMLRMTQEVIVQFFTLIGIVVVMLCINWKLTLYSLFPVPLVAIGARIFRRKVAPFYRRIWRRSTAVTSVLTDTIPGIRVIKSFTNEKNTTDTFKGAVEEWRKIDSNAGKILNTYPAIINFFMSCGKVVIWLLGGILVIRGQVSGIGTISVGLLVSFITYAAMFYGPVNFFANLSDTIQSAKASVERIMDILDAEPEHDFGKGNTNADIGGAIEFKNVNFSFDRTKKVLKNINLRIEPGDVVGIVGTTGSGKSTLINLLLRYYDHYEGQITVGGVDIRDIDMHYYRSHIGYVQQEPQMFRDTIYNNISYGDDTFSVDEIINAADVANAHEFIVRQPDGYDSMLGERGVGLSGGERQRISIARAMLRNPKMLVFDEATASVDSETEHLIQEAIENLITGRTTLMIAHRLSTLSKANKIVVVDNGEIIECGTPEELMEKKGKYYRLVQIQSMSDKVTESRRAEKFE